ncbi:uncharacterized protein LOC106092962 [Stomoxys calcitrans]|uniref:MD-2-related lipid-recognition domain-containing protein n=1 Tax=Stomoxys calcitrans TaxID=35570 RepID=A0A1I8NM27_STOCA|nr:uncharacterized protein LOC106092962 [Stomoxys calcitrans]
MDWQNVWIIIAIALRCPVVAPKFVNEWAKCQSQDPSFATFELCNWTRSPQNLPALSFHINLLQLPITSIKLQAQAMYIYRLRPVQLVNTTWDLCRILKNPKRHFAFARLYSVFGPHLNINHSCPYNHDLIGSNIDFDRSEMPFPVPVGKYTFKASFNTNGGKQFEINAGMNII